jgi:hypothetical protein
MKLSEPVFYVVFDVMGFGEQSISRKLFRQCIKRSYEWIDGKDTLQDTIIYYLRYPDSCMYVCMYIFLHIQNTHTHTHTYIYIYISVGIWLLPAQHNIRPKLFPYLSVSF